MRNKTNMGAVRSTEWIGPLRWYHFRFWNCVGNSSRFEKVPKSQRLITLMRFTRIIIHYFIQDVTENSNKNTKNDFFLSIYSVYECKWKCEKETWKIKQLVYRKASKRHLAHASWARSSLPRDSLTSPAPGKPKADAE